MCLINFLIILHASWSITVILGETQRSAGSGGSSRTPFFVLYNQKFFQTKKSRQEPFLGNLLRPMLCCLISFSSVAGGNSLTSSICHVKVWGKSWRWWWWLLWCDFFFLCAVCLSVFLSSDYTKTISWILWGGVRAQKNPLNSNDPDNTARKALSISLSVFSRISLVIIIITVISNALNSCEIWCFCCFIDMCHFLLYNQIHCISHQFI